MRRSVRIKSILILALFLITAGLWYAVWREDMRGKLAVSFLDAGGTHAIFIQAPSGRQVLIDGGVGGTALRNLGRTMAPWDRSIDVVVVTSTDPDVFGGLVDVLDRYRIGTIVQTGTESTNPLWNLFEKRAGKMVERGTEIRTGRRGQVIDLGEGAYLEILFPDRSLPGSPASEGCIISRLVYGKDSFLFSCDATEGVQQYLAMLDGMRLKSDVLFSRATSSPIFLGYVAPAYTVTSGGNVTFVSDGKTVVRE